MKTSILNTTIHSIPSSHQLFFNVYISSPISQWFHLSSVIGMHVHILGTKVTPPRLVILDRSKQTAEICPIPFSHTIFLFGHISQTPNSSQNPEKIILATPSTRKNHLVQRAPWFKYDSPPGDQQHPLNQKPKMLKAINRTKVTFLQRRKEWWREFPFMKVVKSWVF